MLSESDRAVLALVAEPWRGQGAMQRRIRVEFGWSPTRFYQHLDRGVRMPAAIALDPIAFRRMRELAA